MRGRGPRGPDGFGVEKKIGLINGLGLGFQGRLASRVRVWKNPARIRPAAIPMLQ